MAQFFHLVTVYAATMLLCTCLTAVFSCFEVLSYVRQCYQCRPVLILFCFVYELIRPLVIFGLFIKFSKTSMSVIHFCVLLENKICLYYLLLCSSCYVASKFLFYVIVLSSSLLKKIKLWKVGWLARVHTSIRDLYRHI